MSQESTNSLLDLLKSADREDIESFSKEHLRGAEPSFPVYMDSLITSKKLKRQDVILRADFSQTYGYKLLSGEARTRGRDYILRLCYALELNLEETQRALKLYGMAPLYPKSKRDMVMIIAFNRKVSSVDTVNDWLREHGCDELRRSGE